MKCSLLSLPISVIETSNVKITYKETKKVIKKNNRLVIMIIRKACENIRGNAKH